MKAASALIVVGALLIGGTQALIAADNSGSSGAGVGAATQPAAATTWVCPRLTLGGQCPFGGMARYYGVCPRGGQLIGYGPGAGYGQPAAFGQGRGHGWRGGRNQAAVSTPQAQSPTPIATGQPIRERRRDGSCLTLPAAPIPGQGTAQPKP